MQSQLSGAENYRLAISLDLYFQYEFVIFRYWHYLTNLLGNFLPSSHSFSSLNELYQNSNLPQNILQTNGSKS